MNGITRLVPWFAMAFGALYFLIAASPTRDAEGEMHIEKFAKLPVQEGGRIKPVDTVARNILFQISGKQTFKDLKDDPQPAVKWLLDVMSSHVQSAQDLKRREFIQVDNPEVQKLLGLPAAPDNRFAIKNLDPAKLQQFAEEFQRVMKVPGERQNRFERDVMKVAEQIEAFLQLKDHLDSTGVPEQYKVFRIEDDRILSMLGLEPRSGFRYSIKEFAPKLGELDKQIRTAQQKRPETQDEAEKQFTERVLTLSQHLHTYIQVTQLETPRVIPDPNGRPDWLALQQELEEATNSETLSPDAASWHKMLLAYAAGDVKTFNAEVDDYQTRLQPTEPAAVRMANFESFFNNFEPFYQCAILYVLVFILACVSWVAWRDSLNRAAFWLALTVLVVHAAALFARMYLMDRPFVFVTNLYSSAVFIGFGAVVLSLVLEAIYQNGIGNVVAGATGALSMLIAHNLASGDTLEMMRAVLDTNFWLSTHVTCVTLGYTATYVAGFLGMLFIILGVTHVLDQDLYKALGQMIYGVACFATLLSFTGTVLGGIWADQSWGRFWGWDPKENGALIIVIWNALILHARWGGMVKQRGLAVLAVAGNIVTTWSWFGVNMLGVGLHAYASSKGATLGMVGADLVFLGVIGLGLFPLRDWNDWKSFAITPRNPKPPKDSSANGPAARSGKGSTRIRPPSNLTPSSR